MAWRLARSLGTLRDEVDRMAPRRSRASDGTLGDAAHAARPSRHNPNNAGVVCALDVTHDPGGGMDVHTLAIQLATQARLQRTNPDLEYIVSNRRIASRTNNWAWRSYVGDPHTNHAHFAVGRGPDGEPRPPYDDTDPWNVAGASTPPAPIEEDEMWVIEGEVPAGTPNAPGVLVIALPPGRKSARADFWLSAPHNEGAQLWGSQEYEGGSEGIGLWANGNTWELWLPGHQRSNTAAMIGVNTSAINVQNRGPKGPVHVTVSGT